MGKEGTMPDVGGVAGEQLRTREGRAEFFRRAREERDRGASEPESKLVPDDDPQEEIAFDVERIVARGQGREGWSREGHRQLEQRRWQSPDPVPRSREDRLLLAAERLEAERDAAEKVKQVKPILVILGNPPYNAFAGVSPVEEEGLVEIYKVGLNTEWAIRKFNRPK